MNLGGSIDGSGTADPQYRLLDFAVGVPLRKSWLEIFVDLAYSPPVASTLPAPPQRQQVSKREDNMDKLDQIMLREREQFYDSI